MELDVLMSRAVTAAGAPSQEVLQLSHRQIMRLGMIRTRADIQSWALNSLDEFVNQIPSTDRGSKLVEQAIGFMRQKLNCSGLELKDVAQAVHVSPSYLAHLFKIKMGTTYVKYMTRLRIEEARRLLRSTDMTVSAIAAAVGYEDPAYFHRIFRRESMITPMAYRHQARIS
jgi:two-component system response regulator YesN